MPKINREEYEVLKEVRKDMNGRWHWLARDKDGVLWAYNIKPERKVKYGTWGSPPMWNFKHDENLFQFIQWEDSEPYNIQELIEEYGQESYNKQVLEFCEEGFWNLRKAFIKLDTDLINESEETEVKKDLEWLKREVHKELETWRGVEGGIDGDGINEIMLLINQLDEPEVLSDKWIDEHSYGAFELEGTLDDLDERFVSEHDLQNLLVPKQELPVIPKFVAEWIEEVKPHNSLRVAFEYIAQRKKDNHDDELAFWVEEGNSELFARAWLDGFTVEEERKHYVLDTEDIPMLVKSYGAVNRANTHLSIHEKGRNTEHYQLTEQEIKDFDERFWPFAVPVEELEE